MPKHTARSGFTLIELLIVVSILGIMSGLTMNVINVGRQKKISEDTVRRSNIEKLAQAIESYCSAEGKCPLASNIVFGVTADPSISPEVLVYIKQWPVSNFSATVADIKYSYYPDDDPSNPQDFEVSVKMMSSTEYLRYNSVWGQIKECANVISAAFDSSSTPTCT